MSSVAERVASFASIQGAAPAAEEVAEVEVAEGQAPEEGEAGEDEGKKRETGYKRVKRQLAEERGRSKDYESKLVRAVEHAQFFEQKYSAFEAENEELAAENERLKKIVDAHQIELEDDPLSKENRKLKRELDARRRKEEAAVRNQKDQAKQALIGKVTTAADKYGLTVQDVARQVMAMGGPKKVSIEAAAKEAAEIRKIRSGGKQPPKTTLDRKSASGGKETPGREGRVQFLSARMAAGS